VGYCLARAAHIRRIHRAVRGSSCLGLCVVLRAGDSLAALVVRLITLLHDPDDDVAAEATHALAFLPNTASASIPVLSGITGANRSPRVRASAALAISLLATAASFDVGQLVESLSTDPGWIVRYAAAALEARPGVAEPPSEPAHTILVEALTREPDEYERLPWNDGDLAGFAAIMLGRRTLDEHTFDLICTALRDAAPIRGVTLAGICSATPSRTPPTTCRSTPTT
jgi:HEAT repeat protein